MLLFLTAPGDLSDVESPVAQAATEPLSERLFFSHRSE